MRVHTKTIDLSTVAELQQSLRQAPPRPQTKVKYAEAIELMASDIHGMRSRGYGWDDIAAMLADKGMDLSVKTIRSYLYRAGGDRFDPTPRRKRRRGEPVRATSPSTGPEPSQRPSPPAARDVAGASAASSPPTRPTVSTAVAKPVAATSPSPGRHAAEDVPRWSFPVRPDSKDL
jgi:hypothetical protein